MNVDIGTEAAQFPFWEYFFAIVSVQYLCSREAVSLKVHKIQIYFGFDFEICIFSLLVMSKY
jgi:hypothetical protein